MKAGKPEGQKAGGPAFWLSGFPDLGGSYGRATNNTYSSDSYS
jgi:hypothetical protein